MFLITGLKNKALEPISRASKCCWNTTRGL